MADIDYEVEQSSIEQQEELTGGSRGNDMGDDPNNHLIAIILLAITAITLCCLIHNIYFK